MVVVKHPGAGPGDSEQAPALALPTTRTSGVARWPGCPRLSAEVPHVPPPWSARRPIPEVWNFNYFVALPAPRESSSLPRPVQLGPLTQAPTESGVFPPARFLTVLYQIT